MPSVAEDSAGLLWFKFPILLDIPESNGNVNLTILLIWLSFPYMYPYEKAICQFVLLPVPVEEIVEVEPEVIQLDKTTRGTGSMGSSGK